MFIYTKITPNLIKIRLSKDFMIRIRIFWAMPCLSASAPSRSLLPIPW